MFLCVIINTTCITHTAKTSNPASTQPLPEHNAKPQVLMDSDEGAASLSVAVAAAVAPEPDPPSAEEATSCYNSANASPWYVLYLPYTTLAIHLTRLKCDTCNGSNLIRDVHEHACLAFSFVAITVTLFQCSLLTDSETFRLHRF